MRFGCCINMLATEEDPAGLYALEAVAACGFDYVEMPLAELMLLDEAAFETAARRVESLGLRCESCNNFFPASLRLTGADRDPDAVKNYADQALKRALRLGAKTVVFGSAKAKNVPEGFPMGKAWDQVAEDLRIISDSAAAVCPEMEIAIEPVCRRESNILLTFAEGVAMSKKVDRPNIRCLVDYYHMRVEEEPLEDLKAGADRLVHVHISVPNGRGYPASGDGEDYAAFFSTLRSIGYDRRMSIEGFSTALIEDGPKALRCLRACAG